MMMKISSSCKTLRLNTDSETLLKQVIIRVYSKLHKWNCAKTFLAQSIYLDRNKSNYLSICKKEKSIVITKITLSRRKLAAVVASSTKN